MADQRYQTLLVEEADGVRTITLNRPDAGNAFDFTMTGEFEEAMWAADCEESVRAIVVTGAGKAFSIGFDLSTGADVFGQARHEQHNDELGVTDESITDRYAFWRMRTPVVVAINGTAIGAGLTLALLADIRVTAADARLRLPFTRYNVLLDAGSTWLLPRMIGLSRALELLLTGRWFTGAEAAEIGLVSRAVAGDEVLSVALEIAHEIATNAAPLATGATKELIYRAFGELDRTAAMTRETKVIWWAGSQPDRPRAYRHSWIAGRRSGRAPRLLLSRRSWVWAHSESEWAGGRADLAGSWGGDQGRDGDGCTRWPRGHHHRGGAGDRSGARATVCRGRGQGRGQRPGRQDRRHG